MIIKQDADVSFHSGMPDFNKFTDGKGYLIVLDDMVSDTNNEIMELFCRQSHHRNLSVMFLVQNIFFGGSKYFRSVSLNAQYIICTKNPRDRRQISTLASQLYPENIKFVKEAFADATDKPFSYLLFDLSQKCDDKLRFRTNIFPDDSPRNVIYIPSTEK